MGEILLVFFDLSFWQKVVNALFVAGIIALAALVWRWIGRRFRERKKRDVSSPATWSSNGAEPWYEVTIKRLTAEAAAGRLPKDPKTIPGGAVFGCGSGDQIEFVLGARDIVPEGVTKSISLGNIPQLARFVVEYLYVFVRLHALAGHEAHRGGHIRRVDAIASVANAPAPWTRDSIVDNMANYFERDTQGPAVVAALSDAIRYALEQEWLQETPNGRIEIISKGYDLLAVASTNSGTSADERVRNDTMKPGLSLLLDAHEKALDAGRSIHDFAVGIQELRAAGVSMTDLRWLISRNLIEHTEDITRANVDGRAFRKRGEFDFDERSCFWLTDGGIEYAKKKLS